MNYDHRHDLKHCLDCGQIKQRSSFSKNRRRPDGLQAYCKHCTASRSARTYNPVKRRAYHLRRNYNITPSDYEARLREQGGGCAICGTPFPGGKTPEWFHVDHDHVTLAVRGLLCDLCNRGLGLFKDSPASLRKAASYLEASSAP